MGPVLETHKIERDHLPTQDLARVLLSLYQPSSSKQTPDSVRRHQEAVLPRGQEELIVVRTLGEDVTAAAVGVVSDEIPVVRISLLRGDSTEARFAVVDAVLEVARSTSGVNKVFVDAEALTNNTRLLEAAGFEGACIPHYPMPAGMAFDLQ